MHMLELLVQIPMGCDPTAWFSIVAVGSSVARTIVEVRNIPATAAVMPFLEPRILVKRLDGVVDYQASLHLENVKKQEDGEDVKCACTYCVDDVSFPEEELKEYPKLDVSLVAETPYSPFADVIGDIEDLGDNLLRMSVKGDAERRKPKKKQIIRIGEAKNPGPPKSGHEVKVHHCGRQIKFLAGSVGHGKVWLPSSKETRAHFALMAQRKSVPVRKNGPNKIQAKAARAAPVTHGVPVSKPSAKRRAKRKRQSKGLASTPVLSKPKAKPQAKGVPVKSGLSKGQKKRARAKRAAHESGR